METPGVSTRPIKLISGASPFCETFFDDVKVPKHNLVHEENKGWDVAKYLLTHERETIGGLFGAMTGGKPMGKIAGEEIGTDDQGRIGDPLVRAKIVQHEVDSLAFAALLQRVTDRSQAGESLGAMSSLLKYYGTELNKRRYKLMMEIGGSQALQTVFCRQKRLNILMPFRLALPTTMTRFFSALLLLLLLLLLVHHDEDD